jgi:hypothetical protein
MEHEKILFIPDGKPDPKGVLLVEFPPALKLEIRWGGSHEEAVLETPIGARTELHLAVGVELYSRDMYARWDR